MIRVEQVHFSEVPVDRHIRRVFRRLGFDRYSEPQDFQNLARLIYPENPGLVDAFIWKLGREICKHSPKCHECPLSEICNYYSNNPK